MPKKGEWFPHDTIVFDDPNEEFVFPVIPISTPTEDQIHTPENNYCCGNPECYCAQPATIIDEEAQ